MHASYFEKYVQTRIRFLSRVDVLAAGSRMNFVLQTQTQMLNLSKLVSKAVDQLVLGEHR